MTKKILVASSFTTFKADPTTKWIPKTWRTRDGKTHMFYAVTDSDAPVDFIIDDRYEWKIDGEKVPVFFSGECLSAWHSENRGVGELSRHPHIIFSQQREPDIFEKLARLAPAPDIIPQPARRAQARKIDNLVQAHRLEAEQVVSEYSKWLAEDKRDVAQRRMSKQAEYMRILRELAQSYGVPNFVTRLPE